MNLRILDDKFFQLRVYALLLQRARGETLAEMRLVFLDGPTCLSRKVAAHPDGAASAMSEELEAVLAETELELRQIWTDILAALASGVFDPKPQKLCDWCTHKPICPSFADEGGAGE